tara:strand:+ start:483 stop:1151 length:669 start_codon:yes stop_codon:yes gene_type:complete
MSRIYVYGTIGYDVDAEYMRLALEDSSDDIELRLNSGGGDVFDGQAIYNLLLDYKKRKGKKVRVVVDALAASIASVIAMAGDEVLMASNALMMIHNPWTPQATGESKDLRDTADVLDKVRETILTVYEGRTGIDRDMLGDMMDEETWLSAAEAISFGFADSVIEPSEAPVASIKAFNYVNAPEWISGESVTFLDQAPKQDKQVPVNRSIAEQKIKLSRCCNK